MTYFRGISEILCKKIVLFIGRALTDSQHFADLTGDFSVCVRLKADSWAFKLILIVTLVTIFFSIYPYNYI